MRSGERWLSLHRPWLSSSTKCNEIYDAARRQASPLMVVYMSDGWGCEITRTHTVKCGDQMIRRSGRFRAEFLAEKVLVKTIDTSVMGAIRLKPPRLMISKTGVDIFRASLAEVFPRLQMPDGGIVLSVYLQDGLHAAGFLRRHRARHELKYDILMGADPCENVIAQRAMDWVFGCRCCLHVTSSAIKWGLQQWCSEEILDDAHLCIKSCRNSSDALFRFTELHVLKTVVYEDPSDADGDRSVFWSALGVPAPLLDFVLWVDPRWDFGRGVLRVRRELEGRMTGIEDIVAVVEYFLQWRNWSVTRWAGVGPAARSFRASLFVGLEALDLGLGSSSPLQESGLCDGRLTFLPPAF